MNAKPFVLLILVALCLPLAGISQTTPWKQQNILIGGVGIGNVNNAEFYLQIDRADIDFVINFDRGSRYEASRMRQMLDSLRAAKQINLQAILHYEGWPTPANDRTFKNLAAKNQQHAIIRTLREMEQPEIIGYFVWDEPCSDDEFANIKEMSKMIRTQFPDKLAYVNLFPLYAADDSPCFIEKYGSDEQSYERYLDRYLSMVDDQVLSVDFYPFIHRGVRNNFYHNLQMLKNKIDQYSTPQHRIPFWLIVQMSESRSFKIKKPTMPEISWQVYSAIAYGAKGIVYYTLVETPALECQEGILNAAAQPTSIFTKVRSLNLTLHRLGPLLMQLEPIEILHPADSQQRIWPNNQKGLQAFKRRATTEEYNSSRAGEQIVRDIQGTHSERALVSVMAPKQGRERYLLVVNKSVDSAESFTVQLTFNAQRIARIFDPDLSRTLGLNTNTLNTGRIEPGVGKLFLIEP